jgi:hypothetical protein
MMPRSGTSSGRNLPGEAQEVFAESQLRQAHGTGLLVDQSQPVDEGTSSPEAVRGAGVLDRRADLKSYAYESEPV